MSTETENKPTFNMSATARQQRLPLDWHGTGTALPSTTAPVAPVAPETAEVTPPAVPATAAVATDEPQLLFPVEPVALAAVAVDVVPVPGSATIFIEPPTEAIALPVVEAAVVEAAPVIPRLAPVAPAPVAPPVAAPVVAHASVSSVSTASVPPPDMPGFMRKLLEGREKLGISVSDVCAETKVPRDFIDSIETGSLTALPSPVYTKSHLRKLCLVYGLDTVSLLQEYGQLVDPKPTAPGTATDTAATSGSKENAAGGKVENSPSRSKKESTIPMKKLSPLVLGAGVVLAGILVVVIISVAFSKHRAAKPGTVASTGTPAVAGTGASSTTTGAGVDFEKFMTPQQLPVKTLPVPAR